MYGKILFLITGLFALTGPTIAQEVSQQQTQAQQPASQAMNAVDQDFVILAVRDGLAEVRLGQMAQERGDHEAVRQFGERMVKDHGEANRKLLKIVAKQDMTPPEEIGEKHQETLDKLSQLSGADFDRAYMEAQIEDHQKAVALFMNETKQGQNMELRQFAADTLPILRDHLGMAKQISQTVQAGGRTP